MNVFTVVSDFKFDVAGALVGTDQLQKKVDGLSESVNNAVSSVQALGMGFISNFSGASTGIIGLIANALSTSDKFTQSQLSFVQIIDSNMGHLSGTIGTVNEQMMTSKKIMNDIAGDANKFGLPADQLLQMTKTLSAMLVPKGLAGDNFSNARSMSRNLLKSAPNLGIDPSEVQGQLLRSIEGSASMGDTLFRRLLTEAPEAFKANKVKDAKGFNALDATKRFNILNESLGKFANNAGILEMRANSLSGVMQSVRDLFISFNSILRPLGDVIIPPLVTIIKYLTNLFNTEGRKVVEMVAKYMKPLIEDPKKFYLNLMQLSNLSGDIAKSAGIVSLIVTLVHFQGIMAGLSSIPFLNRVVGPLTKLFNFITGLPVVGGILKWFIGLFNFGAITTFGGAIKAVLLTMAKMTGLFFVFLIPLMGLSRALEKVKIQNAEWLVNNIASVMDMIGNMGRSFAIFTAPFEDMVEGFSELFLLIIGGTSTLDFFKNILSNIVLGVKWLAEGFLDVYSAFKGLIAGMVGLIYTAFSNIGTIIQNIMSGNFSNMLSGTDNIFTEFMKAGAEEFMKSVDKYRQPTLDENGVDNAKVVNAVNNYDVTMNNSFKEVLQPDRIAFTIQDQLEKSSRNRTGRGSSIGAQQARFST